MRNVFVLLLLLVTNWAAADVKAVVFDCDGVLVDSEGLKFEAWREVLGQAGVTLTRDEYLGVVGLDNAAMLKRFGETHARPLGAELIDAKEAAYHRRQRAGLTLIPSAVAFVRYLAAHRRELGIKLGLASSAARAEIFENLRQAGLADAFDQVASGLDDLKDVADPNGTNKPAPYIYREIARRLGARAADVVVFEDSAAGVTAAVRAGTTVFAVPNEFTRRQRFEGARTITDLNAAPEALRRRFFAPGKPFRLAE